MFYRFLWFCAPFGVSTFKSKRRVHYLVKNRILMAPDPLPNRPWRRNPTGGGLLPPSNSPPEASLSHTTQYDWMNPIHLRNMYIVTSAQRRSKPKAWPQTQIMQRYACNVGTGPWCRGGMSEAIRMRQGKAVPTQGMADNWQSDTKLYIYIYIYRYFT